VHVHCDLTFEDRLEGTFEIRGALRSAPRVPGLPRLESRVLGRLAAADLVIGPVAVVLVLLAHDTPPSSTGLTRCRTRTDRAGASGGGMEGADAEAGDRRCFLTSPKVNPVSP